jgi:hypothetical protein
MKIERVIDYRGLPWLSIRWVDNQFGLNYFLHLRYNFSIWIYLWGSFEFKLPHNFELIFLDPYIKNYKSSDISLIFFLALEYHQNDFYSSIYAWWNQLCCWHGDLVATNGIGHSMTIDRSPQADSVCWQQLLDKLLRRVILISQNKTIKVC